MINRFTAGERAHIGVHTCPGGDWDSTHSLDVPYDTLLKEMFKLVSLFRFWLVHLLISLVIIRMLGTS